MATYTTEIASEKILSDNPIHQRLLKAYYVAGPHIENNVLEVGCGEGRGIEVLTRRTKNYTGIDKIGAVINNLKEEYPDFSFHQAHIPPLASIANDQFDTIVSFQVIEHIKNDRLFLEEINRVLKPGGKALITTPNIKMTLTRNPWHIREYTARGLMNLARTVFTKVEMKGITGDEKVMEYYERNKRSVERITRFDILKLQYRLPAPLLRIPYDIMNRLNRNKLQKQADELVLSISHENYLLSEDPENSLDLFLIAEK